MKFAREVLDEHNKYRKMHGVNPLKLNSKVFLLINERKKTIKAYNANYQMCEEAQKYADKLTGSRWDNVVHR